MKYSLMNLLADAAAGAATEEISGGAQIVVLLVQLLPMILIFAVFAHSAL